MNHLPEYTKDGLHMIRGCRADRHIQEKIRLAAIDFITYIEGREESYYTRLPLHRDLYVPHVTQKGLEDKG